MTFKLTILGSNSAKPAYGRHPSAQVLNIDEKLYLVDCGEGTQLQMMQNRIKMSKIEHVFISHLHGDHYHGLLPMLDTFNLSGRTKTLHLYAPADLQKVIDVHHSISGNIKLGYELIFHPLTADKERVILDNDLLTVSTLILDHRLPCTGFLFKEKTRDRNILKEKIEEYNIPYTAIPAIKKGGDFVKEDGVIVSNKELTREPAPPRSYAYCSDTAYCEQILPHIQGVDLLYHESTYLEDFAIQAMERGHSTAIQAATIAKQAKVKYLLLGHFSSRYNNLNPFLKEARTVFENTYIGFEGDSFELNNDE